MLEELRLANEYIIGKIREKDQLILEMEEYANEHNVPIITKEVGEYLKSLLKLLKPKNILEIGTAIGYSGIVMAKEMTGTLYTIEIDEERYKIAKENFEKSDFNNIIQILGDAGEEISKIDEKFDFIFLDAAKGQYQNFFDDAIKLLNENGMVFVDNIMFRGYLYKEYPKRFKTIVKKLDKFIDYLYENYEFTLLPFGDGIGLVRLKSDL